MRYLRLKLLGDFDARDEAGTPIAISAKKNRALLAVLALEDSGSLSRERIAALLWSDRGQEQARRSLRQALTVLRQELGRFEPSLLVGSDERVGLDLTRLRVDAREVADACEGADIAALRNAAGLYTGPLLADAMVEDPEFDEWLRIERQRYLDHAIALLDRLYQQSSGPERIDSGKRLVALDPLREASHRALAEAYLEVDERGLALQQIETCRSVLKEQLGIAPSAEIESLRRRIYVPQKTAGTHEQALPSIAVMPFANSSNDPEQEYFSDGITEDIITELSRFRSLFVIARNSSFHYKDQSPTIQQLGRELGVQYILEGSVRKSGNRVRITAQLIETESGNHLWAERYDRELEDAFALQDEVTERIVTTITHRLEHAERARVVRKRSEAVGAYDYVLRARAIVSETAEANRQSLMLYEKALALEPTSLPALIGAAWTHLIDLQSRWNGATSDALERAYMLARQALTLDNTDYRGHLLLGGVLVRRGQFTEALTHYVQAMTLNPNDAEGAAQMGGLLIGMGRFSEALEWLQKATRLNPFYPAWYLYHIGEAHYCSHQYEKAVAPLQAAINRYPTFITPRRHLAAVYAQMNRMDDASAEIAAILKIDPSVSITTYRQRLHFEQLVDEEHYLDGLRKAGLPE